MLVEIRGNVWVGIISALLFIAGGVYVYRALGVLTHHVYFEPPSIISIIVSYAPGSIILPALFIPMSKKIKMGDW